MRLAKFVFALLGVVLATCAARAEDWTIRSIDGPARTFAHGEWSTPSTGDILPSQVLIEAERRMQVGRAAETLALGDGAKIRIEEGERAAIVRAFAGALAVAADGTGGTLDVMTTYASIQARAAIFGLVVHPDEALLAVRDGRVVVTDLTTRRSLELGPGQSLALRRGFTAADILTAKPADPALAVAASSPDAALMPGAAEAAAHLDRRSFGAVRGSDKAGDEAVAALRELKGKAKIGKGDPRNVVTAARLVRELMKDVEFEPEPWDDSFQWTQVEDGVVRLKPVSRVIASLSGAESYEFWALAFFACLFLGALANAILHGVGFGIVGDTFLVVIAFAAAVLIRDGFFRAGGNIAIEPYLTVGMMLAAMPTLLLSAAVAKSRFS